MSRDITIVLRAQDAYSSTLTDFNNKVGNIATTSTRLKEEGGKASNAIQDMGNKVQGAIVAFAGWKGVQLIGDMIDLGQQVNIASQTFNALTQDIGGSEANMSALRRATGGVVDSMTLMVSGNKLLQMGLATNTDELAKMTEIATKLGSSMGMDATKAMSDFSLMLANNSIMRLDQFGISSGQVRARILELQAATDGLSRSDAFKMAVMEIGAQALDRLGNAATAAQTPVNRLVTSVQNLAQSFAGDFTTGLNSTIGILEIATGNNPVQQEQTAQAQHLAEAYAQHFHNTLGSEFKALGTADLVLNKAFELSLKSPDMSAFEAAMQATSQLTAGDKMGISKEALEHMIDVTAMMLEQRKGVEDSAEAYQTEAAAIAEATAQAERFADALAMPDDRQDSLAQQRESLEIAKQHHDAMMEYNNDIQTVGFSLMSITGDSDPLSSMYTSKLSKSQVEGMLPQFMEADQVNQVTQAFSEAEDNLTRLQQLADQDLITDEQLLQAQNMTSNLGLLADQATVAGDAFKNLSLNTALGQGSGGMQGEMTDLVIKSMKDSGATDAQMEAMQAELDKTSGRETESSEELKKQIVPLMAKMSAEQAAKAMVNLDAMLKEATLQGLTQDQIASLMPDIVTKGADMSGNMSQYLDMMLGRNDMVGGQGGAGSILDDEKTMGKGKKGGSTSDMSRDFQAISKDSAATDKNMKAIQDSTTLAAKASAAIKDAFDKLKTQHDLVFKFTADDPSGILGIVKAVMGGGSLDEIVRNNGGSVPGTTGGRHARAD